MAEAVVRGRAKQLFSVKDAQRIAETVLRHERRDGIVAAVFIGERRGRELNVRYRGVRRAPNVLAFPSWVRARSENATTELGDVILVSSVIRREASAAAMSARRRAEELFVHGILHCLGYDHERSLADARRMERRERALARRLRIR